MQKKLFRYTLLGIFCTSIAGTLFHFLYQWSGTFFIALIAPVNESIWEHMKLLYFPMLFYCTFENCRLKPDFPSLTCSNKVALLLGTFLIPVLFYTYSGILGTNYPILDAGILYLSTVIAFIFSYKLTLKKPGQTQCLLLNAAVFLLCLCFIIFTFRPPEIGIFRVPG